MKIKIFTLPTCPWCVKLKEWLKKNKYPYEELDLTLEKNYRDELIEKSGQMSVPVIEIDQQIIIGYHEKKIEEALKKAQRKE